jgi:hypothetical protein
MKSRLIISAICASLAAVATSTALAASLYLASAETAKDGSLQFIYNYTCNNGTKGILNIKAASNDEARKIAEKQARNECEEI